MDGLSALERTSERLQAELERLGGTAAVIERGLASLAAATRGSR